MTNVMHKFLINLFVYFCLTCFGPKESPKQVRQVNRYINLKIVHYVGHYTISFLKHGPYNIKFVVTNMFIAVFTTVVHQCLS
jgi:hypothetical protein